MNEEDVLLPLQKTSVQEAIFQEDTEVHEAPADDPFLAGFEGKPYEEPDLAEIERLAAAKEAEMEEFAYMNGIDPDEFKAEQEFDQEANEFFAYFKESNGREFDFDKDQIPQEVWVQKANGVSVKDAYKESKFDSDFLSGFNSIK